MRTKRKIGKFIAGMLLFSVAFSIVFKWIQTGNPLTSETVLFGTIIFLNGLITGSIGFNTYIKYSQKPLDEFRKRMPFAFIRFVLIVVFVAFVLISLGVYIFYIYKGLDTTNFINNLIFIELVSSIKHLGLWILVGSVLFFYFIWRQSADREQSLREENLMFRYKTLKSQVNPHFLFNSLNTISELVHENANKAENHIQKLAEIYRYIIENGEISLIALKKEIGFALDFFSLIEERNKDKIQLNIKIDSSNDYKIIPISLQLLIENAVKHNSFSRNSPLIINVELEEGYLITSNNIQRKNTFEKTTRLGLQNLSERVNIVMHRSLICSEEKGFFIVKIPIE